MRLAYLNFPAAFHRWGILWLEEPPPPQSQVLPAGVPRLPKCVFFFFFFFFFSFHVDVRRVLMVAPFSLLSSPSCFHRAKPACVCTRVECCLPCAATTSLREKRCRQSNAGKPFEARIVSAYDVRGWLAAADSLSCTGGRPVLSRFVVPPEHSN